MSVGKNFLLVSKTPGIDNKEEVSLSKEEECEYFKQRYNSLKIVLEDFQNQLTFYKNRCLGVDTIALALKESKQENIKLSKHIKAIETSISILQKRLEKHGLSNSVYTQETELFVPGASKQTLDNLAKETARLRTLLKQESGHLTKKSSDEIEGMKTALEDAQTENEQLKNKIKDMEGFKLNLVEESEEAIKKLTKENQELRTKFDFIEQKEEKLKAGDDGGMLLAGSVQELKELLKRTVQKCNMLNDNLPVSIRDEHQHADGETKENAKDSQVSQEEYEKLQAKLEGAVNMNQQWQKYSKEREKQIQLLKDQIQEQPDPHHQLTASVQEARILNQRMLQLKSELEVKDGEIVTLNKNIKSLSNQLEDAKKLQQSQHDTSTVEILRQQIQVCTEDFNTERKDREQAVKRAKTLQEENERLRGEKTDMQGKIEKLTKSLEQQRIQLKPPGYDSYMQQFSVPNESSPPPAYSSQLSQTGRVRQPYHLVPVQESPSQQSVELLGSGPLAVPFSEYSQAYNVNLPGNTVYGIQPTNSDVRNYGSLPRYSARSTASPPANSSSSSSNNNNMSMPPLMTRSPTANAKEEILVCCKCNKSFHESVLLSHIDGCNQ